ncbi:MAG: glycosyltransferase family 4 protein [Acidimicrobiales bacterium]
MTRALVERLSREPTIETTGILISWRGRSQLAEVLPVGIGSQAISFPARLAHRLWQVGDRPTVAGFDLLHGPNFVVPPTGGDPALVTIHDFGPWRFPELVTVHARAYPRLVERALARGAQVHVVSSFVAAEAEELLDIEPDRIHVIPNGFDRGRQGDPATGRRLAGGRPYVLAVGTIEPRKDLPTLVSAMAHVWAEVPELRLVVAGGDGWGIEAFDAAVAASPHPDRVIRLGYVSDDDRHDLLAGATCLAFPSIYEGFGLPPLEAMAQSTPVVTTTAGALPEVCRGAALLVGPRDPAALARAIVDVATDTSVAGALARAGCERARYYSWETMTGQMVDLYRKLGRRR